MTFTVRRTALILSVCVATSAPALAKTVLPDACGNQKISFDVATKATDTAMSAPPNGMAQIVFIQSVDRDAGVIGLPTTRFGIDGAWVGADHGNSFFIVPIAPGEHHLCSNWHGSKYSAAVALTAEAGKTYYFETKIAEHLQDRANQAPNMDLAFDFASVPEDEGKFRVKASKLSISTQKK